MTLLSAVAELDQLPAVGAGVFAAGRTKCNN